MIRYLYIFCILAGFLLIPEVLPDEIKGKGDSDSLHFYEFEELTVKVKIQEPDVFFILDEPTITVKPFYGEMTFLDKIKEPLIKDNLF